MARVPYVEKGTADPEIRKLYEGFEAQFGERGVPNVAKALANSPGLASKVFPLGNYFMKQSALEPRVRVVRSFANYDRSWSEQRKKRALKDLNLLPQSFVP